MFFHPRKKELFFCLATVYFNKCVLYRTLGLNFSSDQGVPDHEEGLSATTLLNVIAERIILQGGAHSPHKN